MTTKVSPIALHAVSPSPALEAEIERRMQHLGRLAQRRKARHVVDTPDNDEFRVVVDLSSDAKEVDSVYLDAKAATEMSGAVKVAAATESSDALAKEPQVKAGRGPKEKQ